MYNIDSNEDSYKDAYCDFLKHCLCQCDQTFLVSEAENWFKIVHKHDSNSHTWILGDIISTMSTQSTFDFGIYLTKYLNYEWDGKSKFPQQYLDFLKDSLGINWELIYKNDDNGA